MGYEMNTIGESAFWPGVARLSAWPQLWRRAEENRLISRVRIVIEHIIGGMKRSRIVKDLFRNTQDLYDDLVMEIACGLHNFRVHCRMS